MAAAHSYSHSYQSRKKNSLFFPCDPQDARYLLSLSKFYHFHFPAPSIYTGVRLDNIYNGYQSSSCENELSCVSGTHVYWDGKVNGKHVNLVQLYWRHEWKVERLWNAALSSWSKMHYVPSSLTHEVRGLTSTSTLWKNGLVNQSFQNSRFKIQVKS